MKACMGQNQVTLRHQVCTQQSGAKTASMSLNIDSARRVLQGSRDIRASDTEIKMEMQLLEIQKRHYLERQLVV